MGRGGIKPFTGSGNKLKSSPRINYNQGYQVVLHYCVIDNRNLHGRKAEINIDNRRATADPGHSVEILSNISVDAKYSWMRYRMVFYSMLYLTLFRSIESTTLYDSVNFLANT